MSVESFYNNKRSLGLLFASLSLLLFLLIAAMAIIKPALSYDDYYTLGIIRLPFMEMVRATAENVHPPLYYIILKVFSKIFNPLDNLALVLVGKVVSLMPIALILILSFTKIRREFGFLTAGLFSFLLVSSFNIMVYATVIRMYSWGLFFLTLQIIYLYDIIHKRHALKGWIIFTIASVCCVYTHYFAAISSMIIYLLLFAYLAYHKRDELKKWLASAIVSFISYLPWIGILISQISAVSSDYWIKPIGFETVLSYIDFIFMPSNGILAKILEILLIALFVVLIYISLRNRRMEDDYVDFAIISMSIMFLTILVGVVLSFLIRPIFISRYILPCFGGLWLGLAILLSKCFDNKGNSKSSFDFDTRKIFYFGIVLILIISLFSAMNFMASANADYEETLGHYQFFDSINDGKVVIFDDYLSYLRYSPYLDKDKCIYQKHITDIDKYAGDDLVVFDKAGLNRFDNASKSKKIFEIYQDVVYSI